MAHIDIMVNIRYIIKVNNLNNKEYIMLNAGNKSCLDSVSLTYNLSTAEAEELIPYLKVISVFPLQSLSTGKIGNTYLYDFPDEAFETVKTLNNKLGELRKFAPFISNLVDLADRQDMYVSVIVFVHKVPGELYISTVEIDVTKEAPE